jgi:hypothetical protein
LTDFRFDTVASVVDDVRRAAVPADATVTPPLPYAW